MLFLSLKTLLPLFTALVRDLESLFKFFTDFLETPLELTMADIVLEAIVPKSFLTANAMLSSDRVCKDCYEREGKEKQEFTFGREESGGQETHDSMDKLKKCDGNNRE